MSHRIASPSSGRNAAWAAKAMLVASCAAALIAAPASAQERKTLSKYDASTVVATVGGKKLTMGDLLTARPAVPRNVKITDKKKFNAGLMRQAMENLTRQEVLARAAEKAGVADQAAMKLRLAASRRVELGRAYLAQKAAKEITEATLKKLYDDFKKGDTTKALMEANKVRIIVVDDKKTADGLLKKAKGGANFADLAKKHSTHVTKKNGGMFPYRIRRFPLSPVEKVVRGLKKKGELTDVIKMGEKFYIVQFEERRLLEFKEMQSELGKIAFDNFRRKEIERLSKEVKVKIADVLPPNEAILKNDLVK